MLTGLVALRRHGLGGAIAEATIRHCATLLAGATAAGELELTFGNGAVAVDGEELGRYAPGEPPFGALAQAGVGALVLPRGLDTAAAERWLIDLANLDPADPLAAIDASAQAGCHWRAAGVAERTAEGRDAIGLPPPGPNAARFQPLVARALAANLPLEAARLLLADLADLGAPEEPEPPGAPSATTRARQRLLQPLPQLADRMIRSGDAPALAWLLEQLQGTPGLPAAAIDAVRLQIAEQCDAAWFTAQWSRQPTPDALVALALQLGAPAVHDLATAAATHRASLPDWLLQLVPGLAN